MAAASCGELGATEPVRCGLANHSRRNRVVSVNAAMSFLAMTIEILSFRTAQIVSCTEVRKSMPLPPTAITKIVEFISDRRCCLMVSKRCVEFSLVRGIAAR